MHGFGTIEAAARFCCGFDELRNYFRPRRTMGERVSLAEQRRAFLQRLVILKAFLQAASELETSRIEVFNKSDAFLCSQF
jgi:putative transposase